VPAQLNRESVKDSRKPRLDDLRGSGSIEQDADVVILLHRPEGEDLEQMEERRTVIVAKQRNGWVGEMEGNFDKRQLFIYTPEELNGY
jgi:replicative DNA helicase